MTLCLFIESGVDPAEGTRLHRRMVRRPVFYHLEPPVFVGRRTVLDVPLESEVANARVAAFMWAADVWDSWRPQHDTIRRWVGDADLVTPGQGTR